LVCGPVLEDGHLAGRPPTETGDREILFAVAIEVRRAHGSHARPTIEPERAVLAVWQRA